jgi:hypothetical protein
MYVWLHFDQAPIHQMDNCELAMALRIWGLDSLDEVDGIEVYVGPRTAIDQQGNWLYYVNGD